MNSTSTDGKTNETRRKLPACGLDGLILGFPFDQLMNRRCPLWPLEGKPDHDRHSNPGVFLPIRHEQCFWGDVAPGTGNIVICGTPGSGKSTLALQIAHACTRTENMAISAYIALENRPSDILLKAEKFGWENDFRVLCHMHCANAFASDENLSNLLLDVLTQPTRSSLSCPVREGERPGGDKCLAHAMVRQEARDDISKLPSTVVVCSLSPRPLRMEQQGAEVFWDRYRQLEHLLAAGRHLRTTQNGRPPCRRILPLVIVDSLNMITMRPPTREEMFALFSLFRTYETIGVFTVEATIDTPFDSTLADVVIRLTADEDRGYFVRYFEIEKSRYQNQVYGKHPFKTVPYVPRALTPLIPNKELAVSSIYGEGQGGRKQGEEPRCGVVVFPSLHYVLLRTGDTPVTTSEPNKWGPKPGERWGITEFNRVLPHNLEPGSVVAIEGPRGTFKTNLGMTFLVQGIVQEETGLLLHLHDEPVLDPKMKLAWPALSTEVAMKLLDWPETMQPIEVEDREKPKDAAQRLWGNLVSPQKAAVNVWLKQGTEQRDGVYLLEIDFKTGAILPEEFIHIVRDVIIRAAAFSKERGITRVVLDDVSEIASGYPLLQRSKTSGELFLPALAHIMRNEEIDMVVTGTTGELRDADEIVGRIRAVADAVVSCRFCNVFGQRHVIIEGEGLVGGAEKLIDVSASSNPPVVLNVPNQIPRQFCVDSSLLEGLVGFETGTVNRPGLTIRCFQQSDGVHKDYNDDLSAMAEALFSTPKATWCTGGPRQARGFAETGVSVDPFDSEQSEAIHDSLSVLAGNPLDRTVLYTVDEFWAKGGQTVDPKAVFCPHGLDENEEEFIGNNPEPNVFRRYYANVLLLAYRTLPSGPTQWWTNNTATLHGVEGCVTYAQAKSWGEVKRAAQFILEAAREKQATVRRAFWFDRSASETLSCAVLDTLVGSELASELHKSSTSQVGYEKLAYLVRNALTMKASEMSDLTKLFLLSEYNFLVDPKGKKVDLQRDDKKHAGQLPSDAGMYLCWYSQLRDLIARKPELSSEFGVCALPGGGFRGDWFIGVARGSVSIRLGTNLLKVLCSEKEEYKRFARGVGMPTHRKFYAKDQEMSAWPRAKDVDLRDLYGIYENASLRSRLVRYTQFRSALSAMCRQLTPLSGLRSMPTNDEVGKVIAKLPERIRLLGRNAGPFE